MADAFVQALVQGTLLGGYYAIVAVGLSLMVGVVRFINLAHGDMAVLGALIVIALTQAVGLPVGLAIAVTLPVMAALGWIMHAVLFERAMRGGRHWLQWQAPGRRASPRTSNLIAPQRQDPFMTDAPSSSLQPRASQGRPAESPWRWIGSHAPAPPTAPA